MSEYRFTIDRSNLEGKQGILKCDAQGNFDDVLVGVFNVENSAGERYIFDQDIKNMLDSGLEASQMTKWLAQGKLIGEQEHPHISEFLSKDRSFEFAKSLWVRRNAELRVSNMAMEVSGIDCRELPDRVDGRRVYGVFFRMRPTVDALKESLLDPNSNTAFSLRSYINRMMRGTEILRKCTNIFTFDWVKLNGIAMAEKYQMPGLESETSGVLLTPEVIKDINQIYEDEALAVGVESGAGIITQVIKESGQWREVPDMTSAILLGRQLSGTKYHM